MSLTEETFNPTSLTRSDTFSSSVTAGKTLPPSSLKIPKSAQPRIEYEPLYTDLKLLIGHNWTTYHDAITRFIRAELSANEFGELTDNFVLATPATEHAHNSLVCAIIYNTTADAPEGGPAAWVSAASDKTTSASTTKPANTSDVGEQRLKAEVMSIPARDRRRLKAISAPDEDLLPTSSYETYYQSSKIRAPDSTPATAGGLAKTNWDLEIKKRYTQPLFSETAEFPDSNAASSRMAPICYEESITAGAAPQCAELVSIAAEAYLKDFLGGIFHRTRSNGPTLESGLGGGIQTASYKRALVTENSDLKAGKLQKSRDTGLLPIEAREALTRRPLGLADIRAAQTVVKGLFNGMPLIGVQVSESSFESEQEEWLKERKVEEKYFAERGYSFANGKGNDPDEMDVDDEDCGWIGASAGDKEPLGSLLEDCLAIRA
jgi:transcriptional coactivator HFI1/ADA1